MGKEARELADKYTPKAFKKLGELLDNPDPKVVAIAAQQILDRRYGKPVSPQEITGKDGEPLIEPISDHDRARKIMFLLAKAASERLPSGERLPRTFDGLTAVINGEPRAPQVIQHGGPKPDPFAEHRDEQKAEIEARHDIIDAPAGITAAQWAHERVIELGRADQRTDYRPVPKVLRKPG